MISVDPTALAPLYDRNGKLLAIGPYAQFAYRNYLAGVEAGIWPAQSQHSSAEVANIKRVVQSRPLHRLMERSGAALGSSLLPYYWFADRIYGVTQDNCVLFGLRSHRSDLGIAKLQAPGNGYRSIGADSQPRSAEDNARKELHEEFGLSVASVTPVGVDRTITKLQVYDYPADNGKKRVPGVIPCFAMASVHNFEKSAADLLRSVHLNLENFGAFIMTQLQVERLAAGYPVTARYFSSKAPVSQQILANAYEHADGKGLHVSDFYKASQNPSVPRLEEGKTYPLDLSQSHRVTVTREDMKILDANYLGDSLRALLATGRKLSAASHAYLAEHSHLTPVEAHDESIKRLPTTGVVMPSVS